MSETARLACIAVSEPSRCCSQDQTCLFVRLKAMLTLNTCVDRLGEFLIGIREQSVSVIALAHTFGCRPYRRSDYTIWISDPPEPLMWTEQARQRRNKKKKHLNARTWWYTDCSQRACGEEEKKTSKSSMVESIVTPSVVKMKKRRSERERAARQALKNHRWRRTKVRSKHA